MRILAIDPGLDAIGLATYDTTRGYMLTSDTVDVGRALVAVHTVRTDPATPTVQRLEILVNAVRRADVDGVIHRVYVEEPAIAGTYASRRGRLGRDGMAAGINKLHLAIGAIVAAALRLNAGVFLVPAPKIPKPQRAMLAKSIYDHAGVAQLQHRRAKPSADALDAIWLGAQQLTGDIAFDLRRERAG